MQKFDEISEFQDYKILGEVVEAPVRSTKVSSTDLEFEIL